MYRTLFLAEIQSLLSRGLRGKPASCQLTLPHYHPTNQESSSPSRRMGGSKILPLLGSQLPVDPTDEGVGNGQLACDMLGKIQRRRNLTGLHWILRTFAFTRGTYHERIQHNNVFLHNQSVRTARDGRLMLEVCWVGDVGE